ncbi:hypothetical protein F4803DRAFT_550573 [Xylaria telfairii]|nr:hypothetical protein F4803DRAFT_550573 [Xylaria telfairii]
MRAVSKDRNFQAKLAGSEFFSAEDVDLIMFHSGMRDSKPKGHNNTFQMIKTVQDLKSGLNQTNMENVASIYFVLLQDYSWGRFRLTEAAFSALAGSLDISSRFLEIFHAFGVRTHDEQRQIYGARACSPLHCSQSRHDISYYVVYPAKHGRNLADPWSLRQLGLHHQLSSDGRESRWLFLDLVAHADETLKHIEHNESGSGCFGLHIDILTTTSVHWAEYVEYLADQLRQYGFKSSYSSVNSVKEGRYEVSLPDLQTLCLLEGKIQRAIFAVESCQSIAITCKKHYSQHSFGRDFGTTGTTIVQFNAILDQYNSDMDHYLVMLHKLMVRRGSIADLFSTVLVSRNNEMSRASTASSHKMLELLVDIAENSRVQQTTMATILEHGQADSAMLTVLSIIATVCLPASLIASIFSSNLIQYRDSSIITPESRLFLAPQFWIYVAITLPLMGLVLSWILVTNRKSQASKKHIP